MPMKFLTYIKEHIWNVILGVFVVGLATYAVITLVQDRNSRDQHITESPPRSEIVDEFKPQQDSTPHPIAGIRGESNVLGSQAPGSDPKPTPNPQQPNTPPVTFKQYSNTTFGFSAKVPVDAIINEHGNEVRVGASNQDSLYWMVTVYFNTNETLSSLEAQMRTSPDLTNLSHTTIDGKPALQFTSPNLNGATGYALINKGKLYYLVGNFSNSEILASFKLF